MVSQVHIDGLVQERRSNSSALAMELRLSCTNQYIDGSVQDSLVAAVRSQLVKILHEAIIQLRTSQFAQSLRYIYVKCTYIYKSINIADLQCTKPSI